ncbi:hypothetical protein SAMN05880582_105163 [Rhizobium sp. RU20A]|uniref:hypothetical protein n=1 Tax=Rhizobium sp. RU20A TaxID=1907412 RepID=UPI00095436A5|nr:hypothetical protein [Rhizobium sp. RU20A]SIQ99632.1 hypothetical protein SAMN05880582_105163 [Rhizobium sp. RU20A]
MAGVKAILGKFKLRRKTLILLSAALLLSATSGAAALYISTKSAHEEAVRKETSGLECTALRTIRLGRNGQRWIRKYVQVTKSTGEDRLRTALRVAGLLSKAEKADLYQVVVLDASGPTERAAIRGAAIGAEVLFAPDPTKLPGMERPFEVAYIDGEANAAGLYQGERVVVPFEDIGKVMTGMVDHTDCTDPPPDPAAEAADGHGETKGHGESSGHGEAAADGHGEASGHGEAPAEGHGEAPAGDHGAPADGEHAAEAAHGEGDTKESGGLLASLTGMIFGSSEEATPHGAPADGHGDAQSGDAHGATPAEGHGTDAAAGHGEAPADAHGAVPAASGHDAPAEKPAEEAKGFFSPVTDFLFGADEAKPAGETHGEMPAEGHATGEASGHETAPETGHAAAPASEGHGAHGDAPAGTAPDGHAPDTHASEGHAAEGHMAGAADHAAAPAGTKDAAAGDHAAAAEHKAPPAGAQEADAHAALAASTHETAATGVDAAAHGAEGHQTTPAPAATSAHDTTAGEASHGGAAADGETAPAGSHEAPAKKILPPVDDHAAAEPQPVAEKAHAQQADAHGTTAAH